MISTLLVLVNDSKKISPLRVQSIRGNFKTKSDVTQVSNKTVTKADPIFAEAIDPGTSKNQASPTSRILNFFVATPNRPGLLLVSKGGIREWGKSDNDNQRTVQKRLSPYPLVVNIQ